MSEQRAGAGEGLSERDRKRITDRLEAARTQLAMAEELHQTVAAMWLERYLMDVGALREENHRLTTLGTRWMDLLDQWTTGMRLGSGETYEELRALSLQVGEAQEAFRAALSGSEEA